MAMGERRETHHKNGVAWLIRSHVAVVEHK